MYTNEDLRRLLSDRVLSEVCRRTGIGSGTLNHFLKGKTINLKIDNYKALCRYFDDQLDELKKMKG